MTPESAAGLVAWAVAHGGELPAAPGVTGQVDVVVTATADGDIRARLRIVDGRPVGGEPEERSEPELTLTLPSGDAEAIGSGALEASVAFMRGRLKTAGDNGLLLGLLAATAEPGFRAWLVGLTAGAGTS